MARYIVRIDHAKGSTLLEWSTVVDAPTGVFESEDDVRRVAAAEGWSDIADGRLRRVREKGTSAHLHRDARETVGWNRAGAGGTRLSWEQLQAWCEDGCPEEMPVGEPWGR